MVADHVAFQGFPRTVCIDEAIDQGSDYSTMQVIRESGSGNGAGGLGDRLPPAEQSPFLGDRTFLDDGYFRWGVSVDDLGLAQMRDLFADASRMPRLTWWANVVTDAGHHGGGPRSDIARDSFRQSDAARRVPRPPGGARGAGRRGLPPHGGPRFRGGGPLGDRSLAAGAGVPRRPVPRRGTRFVYFL